MQHDHRTSVLRNLLLALTLMLAIFQYQASVAAVPAAMASNPEQTAGDSAGFESDLTIGRSVRAGDVLAYTVRNQEGARIGEMQDILVNLADGSVLLVTMRYSGGLFQSDKIYPVPPSAFSWDAASEVLRLDLDERTLADAPGFDRGWPDLTQVDYADEVYTYWRGLFPDLPIPADSGPVDLTGVVANVSQVVGSNVMNPAGDSLGTVADLIINVEAQQIGAVVLNFDRLIGRGQDQYVLPRTAFTLDSSAVGRNSPLGTLVLNMSPSNLQNGPVFSSFVDVSYPDWSASYRPWWQRMERNTAVIATPISLVGTMWQLDYFGEPEIDRPVVGGVRMTLNFGVQRYAGTGGCNWFLGVYAAQADHSLLLRVPSQTRLPCEPSGLLSQEATYFGALPIISEYERVGDTLVGYTSRNQRLLTFSPAEPIPFEETNWVLQMMRRRTSWSPLLAGTEITGQFADGTFSGSAGCNSFTATTVGEGNNLAIGDVTVTEETCAEPGGLMAQEELFLSLLQTITGTQHLGGAIQMLDAEGVPVLFFGAGTELAWPEPEPVEPDAADDEAAAEAEAAADEQPAIAVVSEQPIGDILGDRNVFLAEVSPDGERLAWMTSDGRGRNLVHLLCLQTLATSERSCTEFPAQFTQTPYQFAWSPDGTTIAFTENPVQLSNESDIWTFDVGTLDFTNHTDDGVQGFFRRSEPGTFQLDYLPMWHPVDGSIYFWRVETLGDFQFTLGIYRLPPGAAEPELVRDVTEELPSRLPILDAERFYMDGVSALAPDGSALAVVLRPMSTAMPTADAEVWTIDLADVTAPPRLMAALADLQTAVPAWQNLPVRPLGLSWTSTGDGFVVVAFSADTHNPLHVFYYVDATDGSLTPVVDFSGAAERSAMFENPPGSNLPLRYYSPWTGSLSPTGDQLLMFNSLGGLTGVLAAPLPPDGSLPIFIHESSHREMIWTNTRSSRSVDDAVMMSNVLFRVEYLGLDR